MLFQEREESEANQLAADFFLRYIEEIEKKQEGTVIRGRPLEK